MKRGRNVFFNFFFVTCLIMVGLVLSPADSYAGWWSKFKEQFHKCEAKRNIEIAKCYEMKWGEQVGVFGSKEVAKKLRAASRRFHKCKDSTLDAYDNCTDVRSGYDEKHLKTTKQRKLKRKADKIIRHAEELEDKCKGMPWACENKESWTAWGKCRKTLEARQTKCYKKVHKMRKSAGKIFKKLPDSV